MSVTNILDPAGAKRDEVDSSLLKLHV